MRYPGYGTRWKFKAIREGVRPDGSLIRPPMPIHFYRGISDGDLAAIVALGAAVFLIEASHRTEIVPSEQPVVVVCQAGIRARKAA